MANTTTRNDPLFLGRAPVLWSSTVRAVLYVGVLFGLPVTDAQTAGILIAVEAVLALVTGQATVPTRMVAERVRGRDVLAGPANDLVANGTRVRGVTDREAVEVAREVAPMYPVEHGEHDGHDVSA